MRKSDLKIETETLKSRAENNNVTDANKCRIFVKRRKTA